MNAKSILIAAMLAMSCASFPRNQQAKQAGAALKFDPTLMEMPHTSVGTKGEHLPYCGFNVSYNSDWLIPNWVAYELTKEETQGTLSRKKRRFHSESKVRKSAENSDYSNSGYSRGHLAPAGDMKWDNCAMNSCFCLTNICPQDREMNAGCWQILEDKCRTWARTKGSLFIVCGPIVKNTNKRLGRNKVVVPDGFFKAVVQKRDGKYVGAGFVFPNKERRLPLSHYAVSIDEVERITGFDLFHNLPDAIENEIEATLDFKEWDMTRPQKNIMDDLDFLK